MADKTMFAVITLYRPQSLIKRITWEGDVVGANELQRYLDAKDKAKIGPYDTILFYKEFNPNEGKIRNV
jgi:hypothetical protein